LIVHGGHYDHRFLKKAKIHIRPLYIIDAQRVASTLLELSCEHTLEELLVLLDCQFLKNAGSIANYTLRALLLLAVLDTEECACQKDAPQTSVVVSKLKEVGMQFVSLREFIEAKKDRMRREFELQFSHKKRKKEEREERKRQKCKARWEKWQNRKERRSLESTETEVSNLQVA